ncbi:hypothetical protein EDC96DRAFT_495395 [Choanephora cucurbitarum]|nr:hypothetical protein EDC96DRAFT_495395 [Choanephora cucurbitarum]
MSCSLSIELLPEFGWSINHQPVYGPGSVFQGFVKLNTKSTALSVQRVRLAFYAIETIPPYNISSTVLRTARKTLFSTQRILWDSGDQHPLDRDTDYSFPFTIQMPMIQFPPSFHHPAYQCLFQLIAVADTPLSLENKTMPIRTEIPVICMPFIETSLLKTPLQFKSHKGHLSAQLKLTAAEFVPSSPIQLQLHVACQQKKKKPSLQYVSVQLKLIQNLRFLVLNDIPDQTKTVAHVTQKLPLVSHGDSLSLYSDADLTLPIPASATPSCGYSELVQISYVLQVSIEQKGPMGGIWNHLVVFDDIPVVIGTLGYGIRTSSEIKMYSDFNPNAPSTMPVPKFMKAIEYEDALPVYDPCRLPNYDHSVTQNACF